MDMLEELFVSSPRIGGFNFDQEFERDLRRQYDAAVGQHKIDLWNQLYEFYQKSGENMLCQEFILEDMDAYWMEPFKADLFFKMGQTKERMGEYAEAVAAYTRALGCSPQSAWLQYFLNNNLGFCLLILKRFEDAERHLRIAIGINGNRHNAWKNLGVSLEHQGKIDEAFGSYCCAFKIECMDQRVLKHLFRLIERNKILNIDELFDRYKLSSPQKAKIRIIAEHFGLKGLFKDGAALKGE